MHRSRISNKNSFILERSIQARKRLSFVGKRIISPPRSCVLESNIKVLKKRSSTREARLSYPSGCSVLILSIAASRSRCALFMNGQRIKRRSSLRVRIIPYFYRGLLSRRSVYHLDSRSQRIDVAVSFSDASSSQRRSGPSLFDGS